MPGQVVLAETVLEFEYVSAFDAYAHVLDSLPFEFKAGHQYTITWDDVAYTRTAFAFSAADGSSCIAVGNPLAAGESSNGDPFAIVCEKSNRYLYFISTEALDTHSVSILLTEGIVLKDRNGEPVAYYGIETVTFDTTTEGKQQTFTKGTAVEGLEIEPDFSGGDMPISAPDGMLVKSAVIKKPEALTPENIRNGEEICGVPGTFIGDTEEVTLPLAMADGDMVIEPPAVGKVLSKVMIQKPETLIPENIAEGVDIAGIIGTLVAGCSLKIATGTLTAGTKTAVLEHNLGVVPDIIMCFPQTVGGTYCLHAAMAFSRAFATRCGYSGLSVNAYADDSGSRIAQAITNHTGYAADGSYGFIAKADTKTFTYGNGTSILSKCAPYVDTQWTAIAGLT